MHIVCSMHWSVDVHEFRAWHEYVFSIYMGKTENTTSLKFPVWNMWALRLDADGQKVYTISGITTSNLIFPLR